MEKIVNEIARKLVEDRMVLVVEAEKPMLPLLARDEIPRLFGHLYTGDDEGFYDMVMSYATQAEPMVGIVARRFHDFTADDIVKITDMCFWHDDIVFLYGSYSDIERAVEKHIHSCIYDKESRHMEFKVALAKLASVKVIPNGASPITPNYEIRVKLTDEGDLVYAGIGLNGEEYMIYIFPDGGLPVIEKKCKRTMQEFSSCEVKRYNEAIKQLKESR